MACETISNPACLNQGPTDPYSWAYVGQSWVQPPLWNASLAASGGYPAGAVVVGTFGRMFQCTSGPCTGPTGPTAAALGPTDGQNGWTSLAKLQQQASGPFQRVECPAGVSGPSPDPQTGACERSPLSGPESACVQPCIRLANGQLAVNKNSSACRVFPSATAGGNAGDAGCPTVCPQACVELWQTCPPGTAPVSTLIQTKGPTDLMALTGPYRLDAVSGPSGPTGPATNPWWPTNYANSVSGPALIGHPYIECYSYNTEICDLPMSAWQKTTPAQTVSGPLGVPQVIPASTSCYANCPAGTLPDPADPMQCLFPALPGEQPGPGTVQTVFCNPQFFNPIYFTDDGSQGIQKGCVALPIASKQGSTCPQGTLPIINENFNLEWCLPECPAGYVQDITQSSCIATCQGSGTTGSGYNAFLDYVDLYATTGKCISDTDPVTGIVTERDCAQNYTAGRCPAPQRIPASSQDYAVPPLSALTGRTGEALAALLANVKAKHSSLSVKTIDRLERTNAISGTQAAAARTFLAQLKTYQEARTKRSGGLTESATVECPPGMALGLVEAGENSGLCYDVCGDGYEPVAYCQNGASTCDLDQTVFACRALCPAPSEGLGPWIEADDPPLYTCAYQYPGATVPSDPNLWATCPDDGRYTVLQDSPTDVSLTAQGRTEPLCVRQTYLRANSCPMGFNRSLNVSTGATECTQACNSDEVIITTADGTVLCQQAPYDTTRLDVDLLALSDSSNAKAPYKHRVLGRKSFTRGLGIDPNAGVGDSSSGGSSFRTIATYGGIVVAALLGLFLLRKLFFGRSQASASVSQSQMLASRASGGAV